jgi:hypothetical protein
MMSTPRPPNTEPSMMTSMDLDLGDEVAVAVEEATAGKVEVGEEDVEELTFATVV